jgi:hypothetical protein
MPPIEWGEIPIKVTQRKNNGSQTKGKKLVLKTVP